jgi:glycosyltransferase involved in cell wall biosynthesis
MLDMPRSRIGTTALTTHSSWTPRRTGAAALYHLRRTKDWLFSGGFGLGGRISTRSIRSWRPEPGARAGVNFIGPVEFLNGLGVSSRGYVASLTQAGLPVNVVPWRRGFERLQSIPVHFPSREWQVVNIVHLNLDLLWEQRLLLVPPLAEVVCPQRYNILIFYWELAALVPAWTPLLRRFDEIWCPSSFIAAAATKACARPVHVIRPALVTDEPPVARSRQELGLPADRFVFFYSLDAGSVLGRKNPGALLDAYVDEFREDEGACCVIKIHYDSSNSAQTQAFRSAAGRRSDVVFMDALFSADEMQQFYQAIDCYVSPHRSEGLGLTVLEAMRAKKPVIATPYGGVTDFVSAENAILLDYSLVPVGGGNAPYSPSQVWADVDRSSLRRAMRTVFRDRSLARRLGESGFQRASELFSLEATRRKIGDEMRRIWARGGDAMQKRS